MQALTVWTTFAYAHNTLTRSTFNCYLMSFFFGYSVRGVEKAVGDVWMNVGVTANYDLNLKHVPSSLFYWGLRQPIRAWTRKSVKVVRARLERGSKSAPDRRHSTAWASLNNEISNHKIRSDDLEIGRLHFVFPSAKAAEREKSENVKLIEFGAAAEGNAVGNWVRTKSLEWTARKATRFDYLKALSW